MAKIPDRFSDKAQKAGSTPDSVAVGDFRKGITEGMAEPFPLDESWHPVAVQFYESLVESGQRVFYEPTDWAHAYMLCEQITRLFEPRFIGFRTTDNRQEQEATYEKVPLSGADLNAVMAGMDRLLASEHTRRKMKVELERANTTMADKDADVVSIREAMFG